ncbi:MAG: hypothetical protein IPK21_20905 [Haliscomenobacter sp.]|nr:hypothetical protein [Haliscomenobacter sp.]
MIKTLSRELAGPESLLHAYDGNIMFLRSFSNGLPVKGQTHILRIRAGTRVKRIPGKKPVPSPCSYPVLSDATKIESHPTGRQKSFLVPCYLQGKQKAGKKLFFSILKPNKMSCPANFRAELAPTRAPRSIAYYIFRC